MLSLTDSLKIIWMLSNFHKINSECWQRTPGSRKAAQSLWKEVGQNIKDKNRDKRVRGRSFLGREMWRRSFHTAGNPLIGGSMGSFGISESNITRRKNKQTNKQTNKPTEYIPNHNYKQRWRSGTDACSRHQQLGAGQGDVGCITLRTGP